MRFLQDLISNRRRRRDWPNPWSLVCGGNQPSVTPVMGKRFNLSHLQLAVVNTEKLNVLLEGKSHLCPFLSDRWTSENAAAAATSILPLSSLPRHHLITDEPKHTHSSRIWVGIRSRGRVLIPSHLLPLRNEPQTKLQLNAWINDPNSEKQALSCMFSVHRLFKKKRIKRRPVTLFPSCQRSSQGPLWRIILIDCFHEFSSFTKLMR